MKRRYNRLVELNVQEQCANVIKMATWQKVSFNGFPHVHGWVFDIQTGELIDLKNFNKILSEYQRIYDLGLGKSNV